MKRAELIVTAEQVVTCAGGTHPKTKGEAQDVGAIPKGAVVVESGRIVEVGDSI